MSRHAAAASAPRPPGKQERAWSSHAPPPTTTICEWTPAEHRLTRDSTPRRVDPEGGELHLDFVVHGDGPAEAWSEAAQEGDELWFVGPRSSLRLPERLDWIHLIGQDGPVRDQPLPRRTPLDATAHVLVTVSEDSARQELALRDGDTVTWVVAEPGDAAALEAAVRALPVEAGEGYAWAAAESRALLPVRRHLQRERKLRKDRLNITGYWNREEAAAPEGEEGPAGTGAGRSPAGSRRRCRGWSPGPRCGSASSTRWPTRRDSPPARSRPAWA